MTERLVLRLLERKDVPAFAAYRSDPEVARYQSWVRGRLLELAASETLLSRRQR